MAPACGAETTWVAEFSGGIIAGLLAAPLYGVGAPWLKALIPWSRPDEEVEGTSGRLVRKHRHHGKNPAGGNQPGVSSQLPGALQCWLCRHGRICRGQHGLLWGVATGAPVPVTQSSGSAGLTLSMCLRSCTRTGQVARWRPRPWAPLTSR